MNYIRRLMKKSPPPPGKPRGTFVVPSGRAPQYVPCAHCGRLPDIFQERGFMIYGEPICEDCFWDDGFPFSPDQSPAPPPAPDTAATPDEDAT